jgi:hypothetical protein
MTLQLDDNFLNDLGLGSASADKKQAFLEQVLETLELRVGNRFSENLTDEQLDDFERAVGQAEDSSGAAERWLKANNPNYEAIVQEELAKLKDELRANIDAIVG